MSSVARLVPWLMTILCLLPVRVAGLWGCWPFSEGSLVQLDTKLHQQVFGQEAAFRVLLPALREHVATAGVRSKPLVFSFHGPTQVGKSFTAALVAEALARCKDCSRIIQFSPSEHDEFSTAAGVSLRAKVDAALKVCPFSVFIFEDVHFFTPKNLDMVADFLEPHGAREVDSSRALFIFTSNAGATFLNGEAIRYKQRGIKFGERQMVLDLHKGLRQWLRTTTTSHALKGSMLLEKSLVDVYVPFLPVEREDVLNCLDALLKKHRDELRKNGRVQYLAWDTTVLDLLMKEVEMDEGFSVYGCGNSEIEFSALMQFKNPLEAWLNAWHAHARSMGDQDHDSSFWKYLAKLLKPKPMPRVRVELSKNGKEVDFVEVRDDARAEL